jgi:hypothetical protein
MKVETEEKEEMNMVLMAGMEEAEIGEEMNAEAAAKEGMNAEAAEKEEAEAAVKEEAAADAAEKEKTNNLKNFQTKIQCYNLKEVNIVNNKWVAFAVWLNAAQPLHSARML